MENSYRIRTNINKDQVVKAKLGQDIKFLEILSLKINQEDTYKLHVSNYGIIVGRVLANNAFGIPNAKVSVFIPLTEDDANNSDIINLYPYKTISTVDSENRRYNLLPNESTDECYRVVGTFPNKCLVLDNDSYIEIYEKYWKYTTVTNQSGDYMIFGVPTGNQELHVDIDLSDVGILSQKPRDFIYKGYNITQFDNASQFKESTNLDNLSQLLTQNNSTYVYPFWGDSDMGEIAITRCDVQVQYKFEPTCVFMGSIISDNYSNSIGDKCNPSKFCGYNRNLISGEGTIEMIRKTPDGLVEEHQIQGNRLIDSDGVWCYQIPMNLDYVGTDEFGNIIPTDNPNKGIPTRTSVRFRVSMQESDNDGISRHRAKYLIPNIHPLVSESVIPQIPNGSKFNQCFEFGSATPDEYFRDLYWNKVYSVKNYIPRLQTNKSASNKKYSAIRTVNVSEGKNPFPFNNGRIQLFFSYRLICILMEIMAAVACAVNSVLTVFGRIGDLLRPIGANTKLFAWIGKALAAPFDTIQRLLCLPVKCISFYGLSETDEVTEYVPCCAGGKICQPKCKGDDGCTFSSDYSNLIDSIQQSLSQEYDTVNLDFYNDWVNGCLYLPLWFWKKTKKRKFLWGLIKFKGKNRYCDCDNTQKRLRIVRGCALQYNKNYNLVTKEKPRREDVHKYSASIKTKFGIIKEVENKAGLNIYYYAPGMPLAENYAQTNNPVDYAILYSTDIILLGSLNECDLDNLPRPFLNLPSTTANIPFITTLTQPEDDDDDSDSASNSVEITGMDWVRSPIRGLFMDLKCAKVNTRPKTCINMYRLSELGVSLDSQYFDAVPNENQHITYTNDRPADGLITRFEITDHETRAMFASLNHNGLTEKIYNANTGYDTYKLKYCYPIDFDGHLNRDAPMYTQKFDVRTFDIKDENYVNYRFGKLHEKDTLKFYGGEYNFPVFNNSFYFYFGLNEGSTALDKFNNLFYSTCFTNNKYPFSLLFESTPAAWCLDSEANVNEDYATISVALNNIKLPYSYKLYDGQGEIILSEDGISTKELKFGYEMDGPNKYVQIDNTKNYKKDGLLRYTQTGEYADSGKYLTNDTYILEVTDASQNKLSQSINISPIGINASIMGYPLGIKYYDNITTKEDVGSEFCGRIEISEISKDGKPLEISGLKKNSDNEYVLLSGNKNVALLRFDFIDSDDTTDKEFNECLVKFDSDYSDGKIIAYIWIPGNYRVILTQYCDNELNDNESTQIVKVKNGSPFQGYINYAPIEFFKSSGGTSYWENIYHPSQYSFYDTTDERWDNYIDLIYDTTTDENGTIISSGLSVTTKAAILKYKFDTIFNMMRASYITDSMGAKTISISSTGGVQPILYNGQYPNYDEYTNFSSLNEIVTDIEGSVTVNNIAPNIVYENYCKRIEATDLPQLIGSKGILNPNINNGDSMQGNYFAAFTNNGNGRYLASPKLATWITMNPIPQITSSYSSQVIKYCKVLTVDKRIDYELLHIPSQGKLVGKIYNGMKMAYDENYNVIGHGYDYQYDFESGQLGYSAVAPRRFYDVKLTTYDSNGNTHNTNLTDSLVVTSPTTNTVNVDIDVRNSIKAKLAIVNCDVPLESETEITYSEDGELSDINMLAFVEEGEETLIELNCTSPVTIKPPYASLDDSAANITTAEHLVVDGLLNTSYGNANAYLKYDGQRFVPEGIDGMYFSLLKFGFKSQTTSAEHNTITYLPFITVNTPNLFATRNITSMSGLMSVLKDSKMKKVTMDSVINEDKTSYITKIMTLDRRCDTKTMDNSILYALYDAEDNNLVYDDDVFGQDVTYKIFAGEAVPISSITIYCIREYINAANDGLMKNVIGAYATEIEIANLSIPSFEKTDDHLIISIGSEVKRAIVVVRIDSTNLGVYECKILLSGGVSLINCNYLAVHPSIKKDKEPTVYCLVQLSNNFIYQLNCGTIKKIDDSLTNEDVDKAIADAINKLKEELGNNNNSGTNNPS